MRPQSPRYDGPECRVDLRQFLLDDFTGINPIQSWNRFLPVAMARCSRGMVTMAFGPSPEHYSVGLR